MRRVFVGLGLTGLCSACAGADVLSDTGATTRTQRGDTLVVRTRGAGAWGKTPRLQRVAVFGKASGDDTTTLGSLVALASGPDGRVFATDAQALSVRVFDSLLQPVAIWGRSGSGPGELRNPDGGLAVFSDGRVVVRDPGNGRLQLFDRDGTSAGEWRVIDAGLRTRDNFAWHGDTLLTRVVIDASGPMEGWRYGLARVASDGRVLDTIRIPEATLSTPRLVARRSGNTAELPLPFAPASHWAWHARGGFVTARGDQYAITWPAGRGVVRAERIVPDVPVTDAEAQQERAYATKGLQWLDPAWSWTGLDIPRTKPFISALFSGSDGSVWVLREQEAADREDLDYRPADPSSVERRLRSRLVLDVFEASGELLGSLAVPEDMQLQPRPVLDASGVTAVVIGRDGTPQLARYRIVPSPPSP